LIIINSINSIDTLAIAWTSAILFTKGIRQIRHNVRFKKYCTSFDAERRIGTFAHMKQASNSARKMFSRTHFVNNYSCVSNTGLKVVSIYLVIITKTFPWQYSFYLITTFINIAFYSLKMHPHRFLRHHYNVLF
jgi:hypothetical protein